MMGTLKDRATSIQSRVPVSNISGHLQTKQNNVDDNPFFGLELPDQYLASNQQHQHNLGSGDIG
jgi:hypothetical protein